MEFDAIIVGGGLAGLVAANRAAELGVRVVVFEKGSEDKYMCNSRISGGTFHVCMTDLMSGADKLMELIQTRTAGFARQDLARLVAENAQRAVKWLQDNGGRFVKLTNDSFLSYKSFVLAPTGIPRPGLHWQGLRGDVLLPTLEAALTKRGGRFLRGARVRSLIMEGGRCAGVEVERDGRTERVTAAAVVIADGGFQANRELVSKYITAKGDALRVRNAGTGIGDGMQMAQAVGAALVGLNRFYGHLLSIDAFTNDKLWPYPYLDPLANACLTVDRSGRRFMDEGKGGVYMTNIVAELADPLSTHLIFDQAIWDVQGKQTLIPPNPHLQAGGGTMHKADSIEALAGKIGVPAEALRDTVDGYNRALAAGTPEALTPPRTNGTYKAAPIAKAPFYGVPTCPGITYTMGGILIDGSCRALDEAGATIPGLFAIGSASGGLEGGPAVGYVGGLIKACVTGLRAGETLAEEAVPARRSA